MKRTIFIGQAMPRVKRNPHDWPSLNNWLYSIGLTDQEIQENFLYSALVDYFPGAKNGSHLIPTIEQIAKDRSRLAKTLQYFQPEIVVPIGRLSIAYCLSNGVEPLEKHIGKSYQVDPYKLVGKSLFVVPLPHPSGASTWRYQKAGRKLLPQALKLLRESLYGK